MKARFLLYGTICCFPYETKSDMHGYGARILVELKEKLAECILKHVISHIMKKKELGKNKGIQFSISVCIMSTLRGKPRCSSGQLKRGGRIDHEQSRTLFVPFFVPPAGSSKQGSNW